MSIKSILNKGPVLLLHRMLWDYYGEIKEGVFLLNCVNHGQPCMPHTIGYCNGITVDFRVFMNRLLRWKENPSKTDRFSITHSTISGQWVGYKSKTGTFAVTGLATAIWNKFHHYYLREEQLELPFPENT